MIPKAVNRILRKRRYDIHFFEDGTCFDPEGIPYSGFFVAYPNNHNHRDLFSESRTAKDGPRGLFPGSAAVLSQIVSPNSKDMTIEFVQYSFRQGYPKNVTRGVVSHYMGARATLMRCAFDSMLEFGAEVVEFYNHILDHPHIRADLEMVLDKNPYRENFVWEGKMLRKVCK
jgi:hypothetical protein